MCNTLYDLYIIMEVTGKIKYYGNIRWYITVKSIFVSHSNKHFLNCSPHSYCSIYVCYGLWSYMDFRRITRNCFCSSDLVKRQEI